MKISIMQPTYLSWIGYYAMIDLSDIFVLYDDVQFDRRSWQQRNKILSPLQNTYKQDFMWMTVPIIHNGLEENINEVKISYESYDWREKHWNMLVHTYSKAPYFKKYKEVIKEIYNKKFDTIADLNIYIIEKIIAILGINTKIIKSSQLKDISGKKTDRLIDVIKNLNIDDKEEIEYISTIGTKAYLECVKFEEEKINLSWYNYNHPIYKQDRNNFMPYMSILDLLFFEGENSIHIIREGSKNAVIAN